MKFTKKMSDAFNQQVKAEMYASNLYLAMAVYFMEQGLDGCAHWMKLQAEEELEHAHRLIDFSIKRGGKVTIGPIEETPSEWKNPLEVFENAYEHECLVSKMIDDLMDVALSENDKAAQEEIRWFIVEQVEEEESVQNIIDKFNIFGVHGLYAIDKELGKRE